MTEIRDSTADVLVSAAETYRSQYEALLAGLQPGATVPDPIQAELVGLLLSIDFYADTRESTLYDGTGP